MSDPNFAARDPIFWLHHCNIDRLWNRWLSLGGGRANPTENTVWMDQPFAFFDETGSMIQMSGRDVVQSAEQLNYRYDDEPLGAVRVFVAASMMESATGAPMADAQEATLSRHGRRFGHAGPRNHHRLGSRRRCADHAGLRGDGGGARSSSDLSDIEYEMPPALWYEVYVNLPETETPSARSPYFAGNLAFFAVAPHHHGQEGQTGRLDMEISGVLDRLAGQGLGTAGEVNVTFVARGEGEQGASERPVRIGRLRVLRR